MMNDFFAAIGHAILLAICGFFLTVHNTQAAGLYGLLDVGQSQFDPYPSTHDNARFCDQGFRCDEKTSGTLYEIGAGWKFDKPWLGVNWKAEGYYGDWGSFHLRSAFPNDPDYSVALHKCLRNCDEDDLFNVSGNWHYRALVFATLPSHSFGNVTAYGKAGVALVFVSGDLYVAAPGTTTSTRCPGNECKTNATRYGILLGAGVSYEGFQYIKPFAEFNYVDTRGGGFPPAESLKMFKAGVRVPF
jgi:opacity protein-like surface antigen